MREFNFTSENVKDLSIQQVKQWSDKISGTLVDGTTLGRFFSGINMPKNSFISSHFQKVPSTFFSLNLTSTGLSRFLVSYLLMFLELVSLGRGSKRCKTSFSVLIEYIQTEVSRYPYITVLVVYSIK